MERLKDETLTKVLAAQQNGFWETYRGVVAADGTTAWETQPILNIGLHCFVIRILLQLYPSDIEVHQAVVAGLRAIIQQAVEVGGHGMMWRWLKNPTQDYYLYPPDWDDTCVAVGTLRIGQRVLNAEEWEQVCGSVDINQYLYPLAPLITNDLSYIGKYKAPFTFMGGGTKPGNCVDPVVCANIMHGMVLNDEYPGDDCTKNVFEETIKYLRSVVEAENLFSDFADYSRFYLSPWFFAYVLAHLHQSTPGLVGSEVLARFCKHALSTTTISTMAPEEAAWAMMALKIVGVDKGTILNDLTKQVLEGFSPQRGVHQVMPIYQHRRLGQVFGSQACSTLFCMEALT